MSKPNEPRRCLITYDGESMVRFNKFLQPTSISKGQHELVLASDYDALKAELSLEKKKVEKLTTAIEACETEVDTDPIRTESESGEVEWWVSADRIREIAQDAMAEIEALNKESEGSR